MTFQLTGRWRVQSFSTSRSTSYTRACKGRDSIFALCLYFQTNRSGTTDTRAVIESDGGSHTDEGTWSSQQGRGGNSDNPNGSIRVDSSNQIYKYDAVRFRGNLRSAGRRNQAQGIASFGENIILVSGTTIHTTAAGSVTPTVTPEERQLRLLNKHKSAINVDLYQVNRRDRISEKQISKDLLKTATEFERLFSVLDITNIYELI